MAEETQIDQFRNTLIDNGKFLAELYNGLNDGDDSDDIKKLLNESMEIRLRLIAELVELKVKSSDFNLALQTAKNSSATIEEFETKFAKLRAEIDKENINVESMAEYIEAKNILESINNKIMSNTNDEHVDMMGNGGKIFSLYDPWSKLLLRNPVKNTICGHIYESESVNAMIQNDIGVHCPILGCSNRNYIIPGHLVVDDKVCREVLKKVKSIECKESNDSDED